MSTSANTQAQAAAEEEALQQQEEDVDNGSPQGQPDASEEDDDLFLDNCTPQFVNYLDVKLHRIEGLPQDWYEGESDGPAYNQHPFRYEVSLMMPPPSSSTLDNESQSVGEPKQEAGGAPAEKPKVGGGNSAPQSPNAPGPIATFLHGRLLASLPQYGQYIAAAVPPSIAAMDEVGPLQDVPEALEPPTSNANGSAEPPDTRLTTSFLMASGTSPTTGTAPWAAPPAIMWIATKKTDAVSLAATAAAALANGTGAGTNGAGDKKSKKKAAAMAGSGAGGTASAGAGGVAGSDAAPLPLPDKAEVPPCVVRIPLDAAQQTYLETLLNTQQPLTMRFRRVLRPGAPVEWEDLNAAFFQAVIPVSLAPFAEPGSLSLDAAVPLRPAKPEDLQADVSGGVSAVASTSQTAAANDHERAKKKLAARRNKSGIPAKLYEDPDPTAPHPYVAANTAAVVSLSLQRTLTRLAIDRVRPAITPQQLIPPRVEAGKLQKRTSAASPLSASEQVAVTLEGIARRILRDYKESKQSNGYGQDGGGGSALPTAAATQAEKEAWRVQFLEFFQSSGQLSAYKAQLTPLVVKLVHERFAEHRDATREKISQVSSELYVYLLESMHTILRRLVDEDFADGFAAAPAPDGDGGGDPPCQCAMWRSRALEAEASSDLELAATYHQARINSACKCAEASAAAMDKGPSLSLPCPSRCSSLPTVWVEAANFYIRAGDSVKAEQCYREAIACEAVHLPALLGYGMLLMSYGRLSEAAVFLHGAVDVVPQHALVWGCIALLDDLYMLDLKEGSPLFGPEKAKWEREHRYAVQQAVSALILAARKQESNDNSVTNTLANSASVASSSATAAKGPDATDNNNKDNNKDKDKDNSSSSGRQKSDDEAVYLLCARYAVQLYHHDLANVCLARCRAGSLEVECLYARIFTQGGQYRDAMNTLDEIEASGDGDGDSDDGGKQPMTQDSLVVLRAMCEEALGHTEAAVKAYKQGLCKADAKGVAEVPPYLASTAAGAVELSFDPDVTPAPPTEGSAHARLFFIRAYMRLGSLLLAAAKYKDALGVLSLGIQVWPECSVLWLGAGIAYHRMGNAVAAEECLNESNCLNPLNPRTWAYLALLALQGDSISTTPKELEQCLQQAMVHGLTDAALWGELGRELLLTARMPQLSEVCLRKALDTKDAQLASTCAYHLAHALSHMYRWEEAKMMLTQVARTTRNEVLRAKAEEELQELAHCI